jgi:hypothetical protein
MTAVTAWFVTVLGSLALVLVLNSMGVDVMTSIGSVAHGLVRFLETPL